MLRNSRPIENAIRVILTQLLKENIERGIVINKIAQSTLWGLWRKQYNEVDGIPLI